MNYIKKEINALEYAPQILSQMARGGILATVKVDGKVNPITIGWGTFGMQWGKMLFQIYIRESRYSKQLLDRAREFTINVPLAESARAKEILAFCGTHSGRDTDKVAELGLTMVEGDHVSAPAFCELPLTLECKVVYSVRQDAAQMPEDVTRRYYPQWREDPEDVHSVYYGEIVGAYIVE